ncbi:hypothetical protein CIPAW_07G099600 [Carya illinoinensis]|uniref:Uncharacterized protein n=1 Tax=Carya illinoinensis TaxID=32201 RepID=A0A8T1Q1N7_CARIL|nr:hypothetical protein CIPAW_07G099600 [Carya illinoinensis]
MPADVASPALSNRLSGSGCRGPTPIRGGGGRYGNLLIWRQVFNFLDTEGSTRDICCCCTTLFKDSCACFSGRPIAEYDVILQYIEVHRRIPQTRSTLQPINPGN